MTTSCHGVAEDALSQHFAIKLNGLIYYKLALCSRSEALEFHGGVRPKQCSLSTLSESFNLVWSIKKVWSSWTLYIIWVLSAIHPEPAEPWLFPLDIKEIWVLHGNVVQSHYSPCIQTLFTMSCKVNWMKKYSKTASVWSWLIIWCMCSIIWKIFPMQQS